MRRTSVEVMRVEITRTAVGIADWFLLHVRHGPWKWQRRLTREDNRRSRWVGRCRIAASMMNVTGHRWASRNVGLDVGHLLLERGKRTQHIAPTTRERSGDDRASTAENRLFGLCLQELDVIELPSQSIRAIRMSSGGTNVARLVFEIVDQTQHTTIQASNPPGLVFKVADGIAIAVCGNVQWRIVSGLGGLRPGQHGNHGGEESARGESPK